jgi:hypothetical protein
MIDPLEVVRLNARFQPIREVGSYQLAVKIKNIVYVIQAAVFKFFCF